MVSTARSSRGSASSCPRGSLSDSSGVVRGTLLQENYGGTHEFKIIDGEKDHDRERLISQDQGRQSQSQGQLGGDHETSLGKTTARGRFPEATQTSRFGCPTGAEERFLSSAAAPRMTTREIVLTGLAGTMMWIALAMPSICRSEAADVVAINVLAVPDASMRERARQLNEQLAQHHPQPFTFDETHTPHISVLHRFVAAKDLPKIFAAVERVSSKHRWAGTKIETAGLEHSAWGEAELVSIKVEKTPALASLQAELIEALRPFSTPSGGRDAFVTSPGPAAIDAQTIEYVQTFERKRTGEHFKPHITVGETDRTTAEKLQPPLATNFTIKTLAIYQLGNIGTARKELWRAPPHSGPGHPSSVPDLDTHHSSCWAWTPAGLGG